MTVVAATAEGFELDIESVTEGIFSDGFETIDP